MTKKLASWISSTLRFDLPVERLTPGAPFNIPQMGNNCEVVLQQRTHTQTHSHAHTCGISCYVAAKKRASESSRWRAHHTASERSSKQTGRESMPASIWIADPCPFCCCCCWCVLVFSDNYSSKLVDCQSVQPAHVKLFSKGIHETRATFIFCILFLYLFSFFFLFYLSYLCILDHTMKYVSFHEVLSKMKIFWPRAIVNYINAYCTAMQMS